MGTIDQSTPEFAQALELLNQKRGGQFGSALKKLRDALMDQKTERVREASEAFQGNLGLPLSDGGGDFKKVGSEPQEEDLDPQRQGVEPKTADPSVHKAGESVALGQHPENAAQKEGPQEQQAKRGELEALVEGLTSAQGGGLQHGSGNHESHPLVEPAKDSGRVSMAGLVGELQKPGEQSPGGVGVRGRPHNITGRVRISSAAREGERQRGGRQQGVAREHLRRKLGID